MIIMDNKKKQKENLLVKLGSIGLILFILISGLYYFIEYDSEEVAEIPMNNTLLGNQLNDAGWMLFVQTGCGACDIQKEILGDDIHGLNIHDYGGSQEHHKTCYDNHIVAVPTWYNIYSNESVAGVQGREELEGMAVR